MYVFSFSFIIYYAVHLLYDERTFVNETKKYQAFQSISGDFLPDHPASYRSVRCFDDPGPNQHGAFLLTGSPVMSLQDCSDFFFFSAGCFPRLSRKMIPRVPAKKPCSLYCAPSFFPSFFYYQRSDLCRPLSSGKLPGSSVGTASVSSAYTARRYRY